MPRPAPQPEIPLARAQAGDPLAWRALVGRHGPLVWSLCRRLDPDPEDAAQEVWEKVYRGLPRFDPAGSASLATWITTVTHRHLVDRHRRRRARGESEPLDQEPADPSPNAELRLLEGRAGQGLEAALALLPEDQRRVLVLHHLHGRELSEIAEVEGVALGTVKSRMHRGRARLAELLGALL